MDGAKYIGRFKGTSLKQALEKAGPKLHPLGRSRITTIDKHLKKRFWDLIEQSFKQDKRIPLSAIHDGICTYTHFYQNVVNNPSKLQWLLTVSTLSRYEQEELIADMVNNKLWEIVKLPIIKDDGSLIHANCNLLIKAMKVMSDIVYGRRYTYKARRSRAG